MRFLVIGEFEGPPDFDDTSETYADTLDVLRDWEAKGIVDRYELFSDRFGGIVIFRADDHEAAEALLEQLPFVEFDGFTLQMHELVDRRTA